MRNRCCLLLAVTLSTALSSAQSPQFVVAPAAYASQDANSYLWVAGACADVRQQTLVGQSHLGNLIGHAITALELRRTTADETYQGGTAHLTVTLSTSPRQPLRCSRAFADNVGLDTVQVFQGDISLPTSPPVAVPQVPWSANNTVRILFQTPFVYTGGTLCIDAIGTPIAGQHASWWMADAVFEDIGGTAVARGDGCGAYGGPQHEWSFVSERGLVPGGHVEFFARGTPNGIALAVFGMLNPSPLPLSAIGFPAPGCDLHLASIDAMLLTVFEPEPLPAFAAAGGLAEVDLWLPDDPAVFGVTFTTQWFDWSQIAASNAIEWTVAGVMPSLDMTSVDGHPAEATGSVAVHLAHVLRLEYQ